MYDDDVFPEDAGLSLFSNSSKLMYVHVCDSLTGFGSKYAVTITTTRLNQRIVNIALLQLTIRRSNPA